MMDSILEQSAARRRHRVVPLLKEREQFLSHIFNRSENSPLTAIFEDISCVMCGCRRALFSWPSKCAIIRSDARQALALEANEARRS